MEGEVVLVFSSAIILKNDQGQTLVLQLTPPTQVGGPFKPRDKIVAYTMPYGGVSSVQLKGNTANTAFVP